MSKHAILDEITGIQKFVVTGSRYSTCDSSELKLTKPRIVVSFQGKNIDAYSFDQESFKFPFQAHVNNHAALGKLISLKLYDDQEEVGEMKLKMQTFMLLGANTSNFGQKDTVKDALAQEKVNWFPIFKNEVCTGQLQISTQFVRETQAQSASMVFEGGKDKPSGWTVGKVRTGILVAGLATAATIGICAGIDDPSELANGAEPQAAPTMLAGQDGFRFMDLRYYPADKCAAMVFKQLGVNQNSGIPEDQFRDFLDEIRAYNGKGPFKDAGWAEEWAKNDTNGDGTVSKAELAARFADQQQNILSKT